MITTHSVLNISSTDLRGVSSASIALVVTSPPYPMIEMWDDCFYSQNPRIKDSLECGRSLESFELMHQLLDNTWKEVDRVLIDGGIVCINIGDATRTISSTFQMYPNHARIISAFQKMGYCVLPDIIWRKPSNAPNKFMGSGMFPAGAYVTYEHEYIMVFRKGEKRKFAENKNMRQMSAYFWEERNIWFSDLWEIKGAKQKVASRDSRNRSAAFPFEIPYRLINMYSIFGDTILDPFVGTGTTQLAAIALGRNSIGVEIDSSFAEIAISTIQNDPLLLNAFKRQRIEAHIKFINSLSEEKRNSCYQNQFYSFPVKTRQEMKAFFPDIISAELTSSGVACSYEWHN